MHATVENGGFYCSSTNVTFEWLFEALTNENQMRLLTIFYVSFEQAKPETVEKVCEIVRKQLALPADSAVTGESKFASLGADSLDTVFFSAH